MTYRIDTTPAPRGWRRANPGREATLVLVGCGGTGSFLAEALGRLLIGRRTALYLVDHDRVEPHNVARQAFDLADVGRFKAQVLAERLAYRFGGAVGYSVQPYDRALHAAVFDPPASRLNLLVGAVDNAPARRALAVTLDENTNPVYWLDCGNGRNAGQVLLGNAVRADALRGAFSRQSSVCHALPAPSMQRPDLLTVPPDPAPPLDCAEAVAQHEQGRTINQVVAALAASYVEKLLDGTCRWMASYFDLDDGTLRAIHAEPKLVAHLADLHVNAVVR